jgi:hypothetical protein
MFDDDGDLQEVRAGAAFDLGRPLPVTDFIIVEGSATRGFGGADAGDDFGHDGFTAENGFGLESGGEFGALSDVECEENGRECSEEDRGGDDDFEEREAVAGMFGRPACAVSAE